MGGRATSSFSRFLLLVAIGAVVGAVIYLCIAYRSDRFVRGLRPLVLARVALSASPRFAREWPVVCMGEAYQANEHVLQRKVVLSRRGLLLLVAGGLAGLGILLRSAWRAE